MNLIESRQYVTLEARRDAVVDIGEYHARRIKADAEHRGVTLGEGVVNWYRVGDLRAKAEAEQESCLEPDYLRNDDWLLEIMIPVVDGEIGGGIHFAR